MKTIPFTAALDYEQSLIFFGFSEGGASASVEDHEKERLCVLYRGTYHRYSPYMAVLLFILLLWQS